MAAFSVFRTDVDGFDSLFRRRQTRGVAFEYGALSGPLGAGREPREKRSLEFRSSVRATAPALVVPFVAHVEVSASCGVVDIDTVGVRKVRGWAAVSVSLRSGCAELLSATIPVSVRGFDRQAGARLRWFIRRSSAEPGRLYSALFRIFSVGSIIASRFAEEQQQ